MKHISTYNPKNCIYCRAGEDSREKVSPSLLEVKFKPGINYGDDDGDKHKNMEYDVQPNDHDEVKEPRYIKRRITRGKNSNNLTTYLYPLHK